MKWNVNTFIKLIILIYCIAFPAISYSSEFDELDKPPEGVHKDQILLTGSVSIGVPYGDLISAEEKFTRTSTYTFENEITKLIYLSHLSFGITICGEYMPIDYIGIRSKIRRTVIVQNTNFGADYQSWKKTLYSDYSVYFGPSFHVTNRKPWDIAFSPVIGYAFATYHPTPIARILIDGYTPPPTQQYSSITYGIDVMLSIFFSGGLVVQIGGEWIRNSVVFSSTPNAVNPQTSQIFYNKKNAVIDSILLCVSAGYAFYN